MWDDDWTVLTVDGSRCAQFEHTLVVTETGAEVLTLPLTHRRICCVGRSLPNGRPPPPARGSRRWRSGNPGKPLWGRPRHRVAGAPETR